MSQTTEKSEEIEVCMSVCLSACLILARPTVEVIGFVCWSVCNFVNVF